MRTLLTARLRLREAAAADASFLVELMNDPEYLRLIGDRGVRTDADAIAYLRSSPIYAYGPHGLGFNVVELLSGSTIGICGLVKRADLPDVDLGYAVLGRYAGQGYASEAAAEVLRHARDDLGLHRLAAMTVEENLGSRAVLGRIGMRLERTIRSEGSDRDTWLFGIG